MKKWKLLIITSVFFSLLLPFNIQAQENILNFTDRQIPKGVLKQISSGKKTEIPGSKSNGKNWGKSVSVVTLRGKTNHFGRDIHTGEFIDYWATVPGVNVWISEYPFSKDLDIQTDETGWWTMYVIKYEGMDLDFSFVYEKDGWITTKSNVITVTDEDNVDLAIQYIDPDFYNYAMKPFIEAVFLGGQSLDNAMVVTVGKSWASMHDGRLPHGDPDAIALSSPYVGIDPIYFNEAVMPDPSQLKTSVDGGVTWLNMPNGTYHVTAEKEGVIYETVKFHIAESDNVELYISSTPDSVQGDNDSPPGQP
jgi:hypothetical protein